MKLAVIPLLLAAAFAHAETTVFEENFEKDMAQWVGQKGDGSVEMHVSLVDDPLKPGNKVARFDQPVFGGDIFSKALYPQGKYRLSFDYLGTCSSGNCGGVLGVTNAYGTGREQWLAATSYSGFPNHISDSGKWEHYDLEFDAKFDFHLVFEQWVNLKGKGKDIYFDNIKLVSLGGSDGAAKAAAVPVIAGVAGPSKPQVVGYFTSWGKGTENYWVKNIETSGSAAKLTVLNYAFGNVKDNRCVVGVSKEGEGDAASDYFDPIPAANTLDGQEDKGDNGLFGHWNQLKQLKKKYPNLKVVISLGGWTWSKYFSDAALPQNREAFVKSCVDAYIKGDVPGKDGKIVKGLAAGVFDGIDIDWEYPASEGGNKGNIVRPEDKQNFTGLLLEFRKQLDAAKPGQLLTIAASVNNSNYENLELGKVQAPLNWINLMAYDMTSGWAPSTAPHSVLMGGSNDKFAINYAVKDYIAAGVPSNKLVLGVPFYGYGWKVSSATNNGLYQTAEGIAPGTHEKGTDSYKVIKAKPGQVYRDKVTKAVWKYDGKELWVYDDPQLLKDKADFVKQNKLGGLMFWEMTGDTPEGELISSISSALK